MKQKTGKRVLQKGELSKARRVLLALVLAVMLVAGTGAAAFAAGASSWPVFRGDAANSGVTAAATPIVRSGYQTIARWTKPVLNTTSANGWMQGVSAPLIVEGVTYLASDTQLIKFSSTGTQLDAVPLAQPLSMTGGYPAYGEGKIFVPLNNGSIQAFSTQSFSSLWVSAEQTPTPQINGALIYHNGYVYGAATDGTADNGVVFCLTAVDSDPVDSMEIQPFVWQHFSALNGNGGGFYGTGVAVSPSSVLFGGQDGILVSRALTTDTVIDSINLGEPIRGSVLYAANSAYVTTSAGSVFRVPVDSSGHFSAAKKKQATLSGGASTTTPVLFRQKLYVTSGSFLGGSLDVFDTVTLQRRSTLTLPGYSQSSPLLSTAYATAANGYRTYLYVSLNDESDTLVVIEDSDSLVVPKAQTLFVPGGAYSMSSPIADALGTVYVTSDVSTYDEQYTMTKRTVSLFAIGSDPVLATKVSVKKPTSTYVLKGKTLQLKATVVPAAASQKVTWKSSKPKVASVNTSGKVSAKKLGKTTITATTANGKKTSITITVRSKVKKISFVKPPKTLKRGKSKTLKVKLNPTTAKGVTLTWKSSKPKVIKVSAAGKIKALKKGKATITVKADGKTKKITVRVK
jgi:hypothetical protein